MSERVVVGTTFDGYTHMTLDTHNQAPQRFWTPHFYRVGIPVDACPIKLTHMQWYLIWKKQQQ